MHKGKFQSLPARLSKQMFEWGDSTLAQVGREALITSVAQAILTYVMGVLKFSMLVYDDLTQMIRNYWWGSTKGNRKTH